MSYQDVNIPVTAGEIFLLKVKNGFQYLCVGVKICATNKHSVQHQQVKFGTSHSKIMFWHNERT